MGCIIGGVVPLIGNARPLVDVTCLLIGGGVSGAILLVSHSSPLIGGVVLAFLGHIGRLTIFTATALSHCVRPPIYPRLIGRQMTCAYAGSSVVPAAFGLLATWAGLAAVMPVVVALLLVLLLVTAWLDRLT